MNPLARMVTLLIKAAGTQASFQQLQQKAGRWLGYLWNAQAIAVNRDQAGALAGDPDAQCDWAERFYEGRGLPQDYTRAAEWFRCAAERGHPRAQASLGLMLAVGRGLPANLKEAFLWLSLAAEKGQPGAVKALAAVRRKLSEADLADCQTRLAALRQT